MCARINCLMVRIETDYKTGFTMIEFIIVLVVIGIISVIAIPRMHSHFVELKVMSSARQIAADIRSAQALAISERDSSWVVFDDGNNSYSIYTGNTFATRSPAIDFFKQQDFTRALDEGDFTNVGISALSIGSNKRIGFDRWGNTANYGDITLNNMTTIRVTQSTGMVEIVGW